MGHRGPQSSGPSPKTPDPSRLFHSDDLGKDALRALAEEEKSTALKCSQSNFTRKPYFPGSKTHLSLVSLREGHISLSFSPVPPNSLAFQSYLRGLKEETAWEKYLWRSQPRVTNPLRFNHQVTKLFPLPHFYNHQLCCKKKKKKNQREVQQIKAPQQLLRML